MNNKAKKKLFWAILFSLCFTAFLLVRVDWNHFPEVIARINISNFLLLII
jgi:hypothetical protein